jgi:hypothetical protein
MSIFVASQPLPAGTYPPSRMSIGGSLGTRPTIARTTSFRSTSTQNCGEIVSDGLAAPTTQTGRPCHWPAYTFPMSNFMDASSFIVRSTGCTYTPSINGRKTLPSARCAMSLPSRNTHIESGVYSTPRPALGAPTSMRSCVPC